MKCNEVKELLIEYLDESLDANRRQAVEEHLCACAGCREECDNLLASCALLADYQAPAVSDQFTRQVLQKVHERSQEQPAAGLFDRLVAFISFRSLPALASLALLAGLGYFVLGNRAVDVNNEGLSGSQKFEIVRDLKDEDIIRDLEIYENADMLENLDLLVDLEAVENYEAEK